MTPDQHRRARDLFEAALEHEPAEWSRWLADAVPDDSVVREEVRSLLEHHSRAGTFLTQPIVEVAPHLLEDDRTLAPGTVLGSYTILRELGRGGMGRVYLASDGRLGRSVALKALPLHLTREAQHRERLRREARAAALLTHPGICTVYALEEVDGELYIATEYVEGHTLREEISGGPRPSIDTIIRTGRDLASALASAHVKGITHRDLKPENIMRTPSGGIKILDFGLARMETGAGGTPTVTLPGAMAGTPAYMAPEQIEGRAVGPAADVFAFGVLMYEWICGRHPFQAGTPLATIARVMESTPEPLCKRTDVPLWLSEVIDRCLRKSAGERFASGSDLLTAFEHPAIARRPAADRSIWWRTHHVIVIVLYTIACAHAWQIKEWLREPLSLWIFVLMGIAGSVGGIVRGHLVFTDVMNRPHLASELRRTHRVRLVADMLMAALLTMDALLLASPWPLTAVLTMALATGIALASLLMEPATTAALLGERT
ncbi:MAG TPA: serine/threonine-protein kinase [Vicinamibacterales bacterium]|nr:serine/threonine-protein kinase [Vicinamibacterales bacterium]